MPGPLPKNPKTPQRRNRSSTAARFVDDGSARPRRTPQLARGYAYHSEVKDWWRHVWASPMREEYLNQHIEGLRELAVLKNRFWAGDVSVRSEIRLSEARYGIDPMAMRSLQWEVLKVQEAERTRRPRPPEKPVADPRSLLSVMDGEKKPRRRRAAADA